MSTADQVKELEARVDALEARVAELEQRPPHGAPTGGVEPELGGGTRAGGGTREVDEADNADA